MSRTTILYIIVFIVLILIISYLIRVRILRKKTVPVKLFFEALRNENSGEFEVAVSLYNEALSEAKRLRGHNDLEYKIIEKLKLLNTVIAYQKGFDFQKVVSPTG
ncbi:MAG TPA: hypothetical protein VLJ68_09910 [Chitinophagaceae bacterium]|nr:hypothetical protein [Chitinophagaceae bacterium]